MISVAALPPTSAGRRRPQSRPTDATAVTASAPELGPEEFTDPLNSIHWGAPTAEGAGQITRQQIGPALMIDVSGAAVTVPADAQSRSLEKTYRFRLPVEYWGQLPSEPLLTGYRFKIGGAVDKDPDAKAQIEINAGVDSVSLPVTPQSGRNFSQDLFIETRDIPKPFVNQKQTMPTLEVRVKLRVDRGSSNRKALLELSTLQAEPEFSWGE